MPSCAHILFKGTFFIIRFPERKKDLNFWEDGKWTLLRVLVIIIFPVLAQGRTHIGIQKIFLEDFQEDAGWWAAEKEPSWDLVSTHWNVAMWGREKREKWVSRTDKRSEGIPEVGGKRKERDFNEEEEGGAGSTFSLSLSSLCGLGGSHLQMHSDYWCPQMPPWRNAP